MSGSNDWRSKQLQPAEDGRDDLFATKDAPVAGSFDFGRNVVRVFDDMVSRSVPLYHAIQQLMAILVLRCRAPGPICDLGCSTGATLEALIGQATERLELVGIDSSAEMLLACRDKLDPILSSHSLTLHCADLEELPDELGGDWGAAILSLVAQFLRPYSRQRLLTKVAHRIRPGGCLVMLEKTVHRSSAINKTFIDCYHEFKGAKGYSETEIARKREALENRLIPFRSEENLTMLQEAGFGEAEIFFTWLNFQGYLALKTAAP